MIDPAKYYRGSVAEEIADFLRDRWAAAYTTEGSWIRWSGPRKPLVIRGPGDVEDLAGRGARSFYGTIEVYRSIQSDADVIEGYPASVAGASSFVDIDILDDSRVGEAWQAAVEAASVLASAAERLAPGASYVLWSGAGAHVRVCWEPLARAARKHGLDPVYAAFIAAEAVIGSVRERLASIVESSGLVKVENVVGRNRLFTAPLSLHRRLDMVAVAVRPGEVGLFTLSWARPGSARHDPDAWRDARRGDASGLLELALQHARGGVPERTVLAPRGVRGAGTRRVGGRIGRFPVMALLQAARYYVLNGDVERAKSFGLNRAIFYAWAKYYGPARSAAKRLALGGEAARYASRYSTGSRSSRVRLARVPGMREEAPVSDTGWFAMGGVEQRPEDFDRNVARRFEEAGIPFEEAWRAAVEYVSRFPPHVLRDPRLFYERVYLPVRDSFETVLGYAPVRPAMRGQERSGRRMPTGEAKRQRSLVDWLDGGD